MSAICRNRRWRAVNDITLKSTAPSITARPTPEEKRLFTAIATRRQMSESALALVAIRSLLDSDVPRSRPSTSSSGPVVDRITIRLRPGDRLAIRHRAAERRMKDSAYIAALVRGHVAANPPLATPRSRRPCLSWLDSVASSRGPLGKRRRRVFCRAIYSRTSAGPEPS